MSAPSADMTRGRPPVAKRLLLQPRHLANESVFLIIRDNDDDVDCCGGLWRPVTLTFDLFNWKLALYLLVPRGTFILIIILYVFLFRVTHPLRGRQTDRQTGWQDA